MYVRKDDLNLACMQGGNAGGYGKMIDLNLASMKGGGVMVMISNVVEHEEVAHIHHTNRTRNIQNAARSPRLGATPGEVVHCGL